MENPIDKRLLPYCQIVFDNSLSLNKCLNSLGEENDYFSSNDEAREYVRITLNILNSYMSSMALIINFHDAQNAGTIIRSSMELSVPLTLMFQNNGLYKDLIKFQTLYGAYINGNEEPLKEYAKKHESLTKKGNLKRGYDHFGWLDSIATQTHLTNYSFEQAVKLIKHEDEKGCPTYSNYRILSSSVHQFQLFGEINKSQTCFNTLNQCLPTLRYLYEIFGIFFAIEDEPYKSAVNKLVLEEEGLWNLGDDIFM